MAALPVVEIREGGEVRAAAVLEGGERMRLLLRDGREIRVPRSRVVHDTGDVLHAAPGSEAAAVAAWESAADRRASDVDLRSLHELLMAEGASADALTLHDLAALALGEDTPVARSALHRAMARPNSWFRFSGTTWSARTPEEVQAELDKQQRQQDLVRERLGFLEAARKRLAGESVEMPAGSSKFLRGVREVALLGDAAKTKKDAATVIAEIEGRPESPNPTAEHALELLVRLGVLARDENLALLRASVPIDFSPEVLEEAARCAARPPGEPRVDLRGLEIITIDDISTTEIDDGVSLEATPRGFRLGIHISDAAHFIDKGSILDDDALARATSYYLPERSIRMLPAALSEVAASLVCGEDRPAVSFLVDVTPHAEILGFEIQESVVRVARRMTYEDCERDLAGEARTAWLPRLGELAAVFEAERLAAGATPIRAHEVNITFDAAGEPQIGLIDPGRPARHLVAELMVLANRLVATWCRDRGIPAIYRKQAAPNGSAPPPPRDRIDPVAAFEFRRSLQRTEISLEPGPHAGLGVPAYLQATSPLRRYQDLAVHRQIKAAVRGEPLAHSREELLAVAASTEQAGRLARSIETETDHYFILRALERRLGDTIDAVIVRRDDRHSLVELLDYAFITPLARRPDHERGKQVRVRVRGSRPRRGQLTLEEVTPAK